jgi:hypothetical protein
LGEAEQEKGPVDLFPAERFGQESKAGPLDEAGRAEFSGRGLQQCLINLILKQDEGA